MKWTILGNILNVKNNNAVEESSDMERVKAEVISVDEIQTMIRKLKWGKDASFHETKMAKYIQQRIR